MTLTQTLLLTIFGTGLFSFILFQTLHFRRQTRLLKSNISHTIKSYQDIKRIAKLGSYRIHLKEYNMLYWSPELYEIFGVDPLTFQPSLQSVIAMMHPADAENGSKRLLQAVRNKENYDNHYRIIRPDGTICYGHTRGEIVVDENGEPTYLLGTFQDITDLAAMQQELAAVHRKLENIIAYSSDLIAVFDLEGRALILSPSHKVLLGYSIDRMKQTTLFDYIHPDDREELLEGWQYLLQSGVSRRRTLRFLDAQNRVVILEIQAVLIPPAQDGESATVLSISRDITARLNAEEAVRKADRLSAVGQMAAGIAHEIRNPLTTLRGFLELMDLASEESIHRYTAIMKQEIEHINAIVEELLLLAKPTRGDARHISLIPFLREMIHLMTPQALLERVDIFSYFPDTSPCVYGDEQHLRQVMINIMKNSLEALHDGGHITLAIREEMEQVVIIVSDNGIGIKPADLARLGEPFYTTKSTGTGLGLAVCQQILEAHNGTLHISSELGVGTQIEIRLPRCTMHSED
ncbi:PAS domain-containing sensor histidine kinase [Ferroacidibacillus organovorans]|uniref:histidine kinase n=1 Tax=Ferroacidibacillus organovorans TaxID=1765683 RepID=A0A117SYS6_9BACL|nr:PAS domain-containing sensor histidine kinase [Ferroacidibacillus organovorans]KUO97430.1 hypothetical protein ATW55_06080 [Ferroacidibacillus organovorans]